jgi:hypothetical protein
VEEVEWDDDLDMWAEEYDEQYAGVRITNPNLQKSSLTCPNWN